jgi:glutamine---fructose-6-phosphate transaminase (isomerizing)
MTRLFEDIVREPRELINVFNATLSNGRDALNRAGRLVSSSRSIYVVGMGASWHAGMAPVSFFHARGIPAVLFDAGELLISNLAEDSTVILLSRSGKSKEIVDLLPWLRSRRAKIVAITNDEQSPLAFGADVVLPLNAAFDNNVSVTMYSAIALIGCLLAMASCEEDIDKLHAPLKSALHQVEERIPSWRDQIESSDWLAVDAQYYFLARGVSVASCNEARLLWEEASRTGATALTTGGFRHGPQEIVREGLRVGLWLDKVNQSAQDLELVGDLRNLGANVLLIGQDLDGIEADVVLNLPRILPEWQFLIDIIPAQIAAECLSRRAGRDCDSFRICSYIVTDEGGLGLKNRADIQEAGDSR